MINNMEKESKYKKIENSGIHGSPWRCCRTCVMEIKLHC